MQTCKCENKSPAQWLVCCPWSWEVQALIGCAIWTRSVGSTLLEHMDSSWDCSHAENPVEFSDNYNIDISEESCFRAILACLVDSIPI